MEKALKDAAIKAGKEIGKLVNPKDPYNLGPEGMFGPNGPFGPDGVFGKDVAPHFPPAGSGGFDDKARYGPYKKPEEPIGGPFGDDEPYGKGSKYPSAWAKLQISPVQAILDGVPDDVDLDWPSHWKGTYI